MARTRIKEFRIKNDMSQEELAERLGVTWHTIDAWEDGKVQPSLDNIVSIARVFNTSTDSLIDEAGNVETSGCETNVERDDAVVNNTSEDSECHSDVDVATNFDEDTDYRRPNSKRIRWIIIISATIVFLAVIAFVLYRFVLFDFTNSTSAISKAEKSVVKIICYDKAGNETASGSGFFAYDGKTVVTNYHVVSEGYSCKVSTDRDNTFNVSSLKAYSKEKDIAVITLSEETGVEPLEFGDADQIDKGENVAAIGSPLGVKNSVSTGVLSGRIYMNEMDVLQFTAAISPGSSGGALFDKEGKVIGVTFASCENGQNLNLAIPIHIVDDILKDNSYHTSVVSALYYNEHPWLKYEREGWDVSDVSLYELNAHPENYNGKYVRLNTYVSSFRYEKLDSKYSSEFGATESISIYLSDKEDISGNFDLDKLLIQDVTFEGCPIVCASTILNDETYVDEDLSVGDNVVVIGMFIYVKSSHVNCSSISCDVVRKNSITE